MSVTLQQYLDGSSEASSKLETYDTVTAVIGNEACDLDSIVSSILYGYCVQHEHGEDNEIAVPLLQCAEENFKLRGDAVMLFQQLKLDATKLTFVENVDLKSLATAGKLNIVLVDTNTLPADLHYLVPHVKKIIDHHKDEGVEYHPDCERVIESVGSCATLVADRLFSKDDVVVGEVIAELLLATILVDTFNLSPTAKRATDKDRDIAEKLSNLVTISNDELYRSVLGARCDNSAFSVTELLEKDYKIAERAGVVLGFCSILGQLDEIAKDQDFTKEATKFSLDKKLDLLLLLGVDVEEAELRGRSIGVFQPPGKGDSSLKESVIDFLKNCKDIRCDSEKFYEGGLVVLNQGNTAASRKVILPIVMEFISGDTVAIDPSASIFVNVKSNDATLDSFVHVDPANQETKGSGGPPEQPIILESAEPQAPLEPVVKIITGPKGKSDDDDDEGMASGGKEYSVSYEGNDQLRHKVMEPDEGRPPELPVIKEYSAEEERSDMRRYRTVTVGDVSVQIDMQAVEPYRKVIQHMGYKGTTAIVIMSACYLPPRSLPNHTSLLSQVFYYVISALNRLVVDNYIIVYFHSAAPRRSMPGFGWLRQFYQMVDRRLRKNLMQLLIVHPSMWIKTMLVLARPFISSKFFRKVHMLPTIGDVEQFLKLDDTYIPKPVIDHDKALLSRRQAYVVAPPSGQDKPKDSDKTQGENDKPKDDGDKPQDGTVITPSVTSDN